MGESVRESGVPETDIVLVGRSLGSGPTWDLASRHPDVLAVVLLSPLLSCIKVGVKNRVAGFMLRPLDIMRNVDRAADVTKSPVLIVHGTEDRVIPFSHAEGLEKV